MCAGDRRQLRQPYVGYPGSVIVIRHDLTGGEAAALAAGTTVIYSMYGHLAGLEVKVGAPVSQGQKVAKVLDQGINSHLHWEIRSARRPPLCGSTVQGPGYADAGTDPRSYGYLSPSKSIRALDGAR